MNGGMSGIAERAIGQAACRMLESQQKRARILAAVDTGPRFNLAAIFESMSADTRQEIKDHFADTKREKKPLDLIISHFMSAIQTYSTERGTTLIPENLPELKKQVEDFLTSLPTKLKDRSKRNAEIAAVGQKIVQLNTSIDFFKKRIELRQKEEPAKRQALHTWGVKRGHPDNQFNEAKSLEELQGAPQDVQDVAALLFNDILGEIAKRTVELQKAEREMDASLEKFHYLETADHLLYCLQGFDCTLTPASSGVPSATTCTLAAIFERFPEEIRKEIRDEATVKSSPVKIVEHFMTGIQKYSESLGIKLSQEREAMIKGELQTVVAALPAALQKPAKIEEIAALGQKIAKIEKDIESHKARITLRKTEEAAKREAMQRYGKSTNPTNTYDKAQSWDDLQGVSNRHVMDFAGLLFRNILPDLKKTTELLEKAIKEKSACEEEIKRLEVKDPFTYSLEKASFTF